MPLRRGGNPAFVVSKVSAPHAEYHRYTGHGDSKVSAADRLQPVICIDSLSTSSSGLPPADHTAAVQHPATPVG